MANPYPTTGTQEGDIKAGLIQGGVYNPNGQAPVVQPNTQNPTSLQNTMTSPGVPPTGLFDSNPPPMAQSNFQGFLQTALDRLNVNNDLLKFKNILVKNLYDGAGLKPDELASLPQPLQQAVTSGSRADQELQLRVLQDSIAGRTSTMNTAISFLTSGYEKSLSQLESQKQDAQSLISSTIQQYGKNSKQVLTQLYGPDRVAELQRITGIDLSNVNDLPLSIAERKSTGGAGGGGAGGISSTTQAIIDNPSLFDDLTPTVRGQVVAQLQAQGYDTSNLGQKGLSDTAIGQVAQTQKALDDLMSLRTIIGSNLQYIGPIKGLQKLNPYSKAKQVQADVDRVKQTVGKALEGGVLRKEDEDKYKKILATLNDTPDTAVYKINALISSIQRDIQTYKSLQQSSGRSLNVGASLNKKGAKTEKVDLRTKYTY